MSGTFVGMPAFPKAAHEAVNNPTLRGNLRHATHTIRTKRAKAVAEVSDWAELREAASGSRITRSAISTAIWCGWRSR